MPNASVLIHLLLLSGAAPLAPARSAEPSSGAVAPAEARLRVAEDEQQDRDAAILACKKQLTGKSPQQRRAALLALAPFGFDGDRPDRAVASLIASALRDDDFGVRAEAARLLGIGQAPEVAVKELAATLDVIERTLFRVMEQVERYRNTRSTQFLTRIPEVQGVQGLAEYPGFAEAVIHALGQLRDDRCVSELSDFLKMPLSSSSDGLVCATVDALLGLGSRNAAEAVVSLVAELEDEVGPPAPPVEKPRKWSGDPRFGRLNGLRSFQREYAPVVPETYGEVLAKLRAWASARALEPLKEGADEEVVKQWFRKARGELPARLGSLSRVAPR